jgi:hypothetical protein
MSWLSETDISELPREYVDVQPELSILLAVLDDSYLLLKVPVPCAAPATPPPRRRRPRSRTPEKVKARLCIAMRLA